MVKFEITVPVEQALPLASRTVCDVCQSYRTDPLLGKMVNWRGSVKDEYFSILFFKGILVVSLEEREMMLGHNAVKYAMSSALAAAIKGDASAPERTEASFDYYLKICPKEIETVSFTDVMAALAWKYAPNAKIDYDYLSD